ncbi:hypothetical protein [Aquisphaera insulae]|uniref:hypothetical protein n=1 Tax=Aquisphaera insulae TaxID=2712864 RepID=UPI00202F26E8|nr:hypothetical protein [Aquisphaera insulae]
MSLPIQPAAARPAPRAGGRGFLQDPGHFIDVFLGSFRRDLLSFYPGSTLERDQDLGLAGELSPPRRIAEGAEISLDFRIEEDDAWPPNTLRVSLFGCRYRISVPSHAALGPRDRDLIRAIGLVMSLYFRILFRSSEVSLLQLRRGMPEDHYVAASVEPGPYASPSTFSSRIAEAILTLRTMALSTYENRRVATGALILGPPAASSPHDARPAATEAMPFGVELTALRTLHRLCDGRRTLYLVDEQGRLEEVIDIQRWARTRRGRGLRIADPNAGPSAGAAERGRGSALPVPCPRVYESHALATQGSGHICLVLSPNQEIKVFAQGVQAFVFAQGRWRVQDPETRFAEWSRAVRNPGLARRLFQTALDLAEERQGGLLVVVEEADRAVGNLISVQDLVEGSPAVSPCDDEAESPSHLFTLHGLTVDENSGTRIGDPTRRPSAAAADSPLSKRSIHYLARGARVMELAPAVLEALASIDGALVTDSAGRLIAFGAILRHDARGLDAEGTGPGTDPPVAEGARTTAALVASRFGPVLKVSEDGIISCFMDGRRIWDL